MFAAFGACIWLIFSPSGKDREKQAQGVGYNDKIPDPAAGEIPADKRDAYEQENLRQRQQRELVSLGEFSSLSGSESETGDSNAGKDEPGVIREGNYGSRTESRPSIGNAASSYHDINRTLGSFYDKPADDPEKEEMKKRLAGLEALVQEKDNRQSAMDEQLALMEKSYQLAARYMPQAGTAGNVQYPDEGGFSSDGDNAGIGAEEMKNRIVRSSKGSSGKTAVTPVKKIQDRTVSSLRQDYSGDELLSLYDQPRNTGNTLKAEESKPDRNTVKACVHEDQAVLSGQSVFIRLLETVAVENTVLPAGTVITAKAALQGERLELAVSSIEHEGVIYPVKISAFDTDGTKGLYVPATMETDALKEVAANMGGSMGTSLSLAQNAGAQIASDLTKGAVQGVSAYMQKKIKMVKVHLKAGHKILLFPEKQ
jgi:conjugative transposon TraM protein